MPRLECYFDCSSPWTYLCFEALQPIAMRHDVAIEWLPILVGGIFDAALARSTAGSTAGSTAATTAGSTVQRGVVR